MCGHGDVSRRVNTGKDGRRHGVLGARHWIYKTILSRPRSVVVAPQVDAAVEFPAGARWLSGVKLGGIVPQRRRNGGSVLATLGIRPFSAVHEAILAVQMN